MLHTNPIQMCQNDEIRKRELKQEAKHILKYKETMKLREKQREKGLRRGGGGGDGMIGMDIVVMA